MKRKQNKKLTSKQVIYNVFYLLISATWGSCHSSLWLVNPLSPKSDQHQISHHMCLSTHTGHENLANDHQRWIVLMFEKVLPNTETSTRTTYIPPELSLFLRHQCPFWTYRWQKLWFLNSAWQAFNCILTETYETNGNFIFSVSFWFQYKLQ